MYRLVLDLRMIASDVSHFVFSLFPQRLRPVARKRAMCQRVKESMLVAIMIEWAAGITVIFPESRPRLMTHPPLSFHTSLRVRSLQSLRHPLLDFELFVFLPSPTLSLCTIASWCTNTCPTAHRRKVHSVICSDTSRVSHGKVFILIARNEMESLRAPTHKSTHKATHKSTHKSTRKSTLKSITSHDRNPATLHRQP